MLIEKEYIVKVSEMGYKNKATNKAIFSYLEDIAAIHSGKAGCGIFDMPNTKLTWLLLEWKLEVIRRPNYLEKIKVVTWSKEAVKCYAYRDFEIFDVEGNVIAKAASKWVLFDIEKCKIVKVPTALHEKYYPEENKNAFDSEELFEKIKEPENYQSEISYKIRRSDIDVNNHVHNLNYIELANEALPEDVYRGALFKNVRITYKKEIKLGEIIKCKYAFKDNKYIVVVKSEDESVLHAIIEMY